MKKLKVFRVSPEVYQRFVAATSGIRNRSEHIRNLLSKACEAPPARYPQRGIKPDLQPFSIFMAEEDVEKLSFACDAASVSRNIFVEAVLASAANEAHHG